MRKLTNKTATNKLYALGIIALSTLSVLIDGDATGLILGLMMGVPLLLAKKNIILD